MVMVKTTNKSRHNEDGLVAMIVAGIIMVVLSLVTLGFARLMQREQRQSVDRSLSSQAFYAAESAINDAVAKIQDKTSPYTLNKPNCDTTGSDAIFPSGTVDSSLGSSYTCLIINQEPPSLEYTNNSVTTANSKVVPVHATTNVNIATISLSWEDSTQPNPVANCVSAATPTLPPISGWGSASPGLLRVDLIPADVLNRDTLAAKTASMYLYPVNNSCTGRVSSVAYNTLAGDANNGKILLVECKKVDVSVANHPPHACNLSINMALADQNKTYYLRMRSVYRDSSVTVKIYDGATPQNQLNLGGAQVLIDSTGKVNDVVRRIQVRVPVKRSYAVPENVLQTTDTICKLVQIAPPTTAVDVCPH